MKFDEKDILYELSWDTEIAIQAAAYSVYRELLPDGREPVTPKQFHELFDKNLDAFHSLIEKEMEEIAGELHEMGTKLNGS